MYCCTSCSPKQLVFVTHMFMTISIMCLGFAQSNVRNIMLKHKWKFVREGAKPETVWLQMIYIYHVYYAYCLHKYFYVLLQNKLCHHAEWFDSTTLKLVLSYFINAGAPIQHQCYNGAHKNFSSTQVYCWARTWSRCWILTALTCYVEGL